LVRHQADVSTKKRFTPPTTYAATQKFDLVLTPFTERGSVPQRQTYTDVWSDRPFALVRDPPSYDTLVKGAVDEAP
jgi:hypothetical protein